MKNIIIAILLLCAVNVYAGSTDTTISDPVYTGYHANVQKSGSKYGLVIDSSDAYMISDLDETTYTGEKYYGFLASDGQWFIMQATSTDTVYRYIHGTTEATYSTKWSTRHSNSYATWATEMK